MSGRSSSTFCTARTGSCTANVEPLPVPSLSRLHLAAVQLDDVADDGQPEPEAAVRRVAEASPWRKRSNT